MAKMVIIAVNVAQVFDTNIPDGLPLNTYFWPFFVFSCPPAKKQKKTIENVKNLEQLS